MIPVKMRLLPTFTTDALARAVQSAGLGLVLVSVLEDAHAIDTRRYFPLDLGATWTTKGTSTSASGEQPPSYTTVSTMVAGKIVDGKQTIKLSWKSDSDETDRTANLFIQDASGTQVVALEPMEPHPMKAECVPVPSKPFYILPGHARIGQTFATQMTSKCGGLVARMSGVGTIVGFTTTVVPAGTFRTLVLKHAYTIAGTWEGKQVPPTRQTQTWFLARDVGLVKNVTEYFGAGSPLERATDTEVLVSTNRKYDASAGSTD